MIGPRNQHRSIELVESILTSGDTIYFPSAIVKLSKNRRFREVYVNGCFSGSYLNTDRAMSAIAPFDSPLLE